ncbi:MAG: S41 family peptidase [Acholeplasma sp.]|nr:S41 family peptidase [Acholeplasma sp.]
MKKVTSLLLTVFVVFFLYSCTKEAKTIDDIIKEIEVPNEVEKDFSLPLKVDDYTLSWQTACDSLDFSLGLTEVNFSVTRGREDILFDLVLTIFNDIESKVFTYKIKILAATDADTDKFTITYYIDNAFHYEDIVQKGTIPVKINDPVTGDKTFLGWYTEKDFKNPYTFSTPITSDIDLYAKIVETPVTNDQKFALDVEMIENLDIKITGSKIVLPSSGTYTKITWKSSNTAVITNDGFVFYPSSDKTVTLTATLSLSNETKIVTKNVNIGKFNSSTNLSVSKKDLKFTNLDSYVSTYNNRKITTYYLNDGDLPYVEVVNFFTALDGFFMISKVKSLINFTYLANNVLAISYKYNNADYVATLDFTTNTIKTSTISFFDYYNVEYNDDSSYDDYGIVDQLIDYNPGNEITLNLNDYNVNTFVYHDNGSIKYLIPFHFANLIFTGSSYYNVYYNGEEYFGFYDLPYDEYTGRINTQVTTTKYNNKALSDDVIYANYNFFAFTLNYYYGLKDPDNIVLDYYEEMLPYQSQMLSSNAEVVTYGYAEFINKVLDDLHTWIALTSYYNKKSFQFNDNQVPLGERIDQFYSTYYDIEDEANLRYGFLDSNYNLKDEYTTYMFLDNEKTTAEIFLYDFTLPDYGSDSLTIINNALVNIFKESSKVENIVLDLTVNGGGHIGAVYHVLAFMSDKDIITSEINPFENSSYTSKSTVTLPSKVSASTLSKSRNANWYILTTIGTFSSANMTVAIAKNQGIATIIGQKTGGGASSIQPIVLVDGSIVYISGLNVLALNSPSGYTSVEFGIEPDILVNNFEDLFNSQKILNLLN